jgi:predicted flap endonuclease-1-like 5' DNA nuclease
MRSDYALYGVAIIFFVITAFSLIVLSGVEQSLSVVTTVVLGILFVGLGFTLRPSTKTARATAPTAQTQAPVAIETPIKEEKEAVVETASKTLELTLVKGIKEKRAAQLKALGINTVEELSTASPEKLAKKLKISPKFTESWVQNAKKLVEKP